MEGAGADNAKFKEFLAQFCEKYTQKSPKKDAGFTRHPYYYILQEEREAECLSFTIQFLTESCDVDVKCPNQLASVIARHVADNMESTDLEPLMEPEESESEEGTEDETDKLPTTNLLEEDEKGNDESPENKDKEPKEPLPRRLKVDLFSEAVEKEVIKVCKQYHEKFPTIKSSPSKQVVSYQSIRNGRRKMEDRHVILPYFNEIFGLKKQPQQSYYAVFDGHAGVEAATYAATHLHNNIVKHKDFGSKNINSLKDAYTITDESFIKKGKREEIRSGSTGVSALVDHEKLYIAWLGDSQVMLVRDGRPIKLMTPHKPDREDEKQRIEALGGCVVWFGAWRVNGTLSVSRAIGDGNHKPFVSGEPDVAAFDLDGSEDYLVLGCDGLWDTVTPDDVADQVYKYLVKEKGDIEKAAHKLVNLAVEKGSADNITVIVIFFRKDISPPKIEKEATENSKVETNESDQSSEKSEKHEKENNDEKGSKSSNDESSQNGSSNSSSDSKGKQKEASTEVLLSRESSEGLQFSLEGSPLLAVGGVLQDISAKNSPSNHGNGTHSSASQKPTLSSGNDMDSLSTNQSEGNSEVQSNGSSTDIALISKTANRCVTNRRGKQGRRRRNNHHGTGKENRKNSREKSVPTSWRTPMTSPKLKSSPSILSQTQKSMIRSGDQIFEMLTGCSPQVIRKVKGNVQSNKWTVAVECDSTAFADKQVPTIIDDGLTQSRKQSRLSFLSSSGISSTLASPIDPIEIM